MEIRLRPAAQDDLPAIRSCAEAAYALYIDRIGRRPAPMDAEFGDQVRKGLIDVIEADGDWAGYAVTERQGDALFVENVALLPAFQGRGLARWLFEALNKRAQQAELVRIKLYTNAAMHENLALYPKLGFHVTGTRVENGFNRVYFEKRVHRP